MVRSPNFSRFQEKKAMSQFAVMNIDKEEEILSALVSGHIAGTGRYKFLAKKRRDKKIEWAHFIERDNGLKEKVYRGQVNDEKELGLVLEIMNKNLARIFGPHAAMKQGIPEFRSLMGTRFDDTVNWIILFSFSGTLNNLQ
jgi:hypothetical protein